MQQMSPWQDKLKITTDTNQFRTFIGRKYEENATEHNLPSPVELFIYTDPDVHYNINLECLEVILTYMWVLEQ